MKQIFKHIFILTAAIALTTASVAQTQLITDGGFEGGPGSTAWTQASTNFGTPLCDIPTCGNGTGTGPRTGGFWAWFGGIAGTTETGSVSQTITIPNGGTASLTFWIEQIVCDGPQDIMEVKVDGTTVFSTDGASALCGVLGYSQQTVDISAYADGNSHVLEFTSTTFSANGNLTNFFLDDVSVIHTPQGGGVSCNDTTAFAGVNVAIPDNDPTGVSNSQTVSGVAGNTLGVDVKLAKVCFTIDHTWVGDLVVSLTAPNGTNVVLLDRPGFPVTLNGCDGDNVDICIQLGTGNEAETVCSNLPAISGNYTAANGSNLNALNVAGGSPNGNWQLTASDNAGFDTGSIIGWSLIFDNGPVANWTAPAEVCESAASINLDPLVTGTPGGTWSGSGVTGNTFDPSGLSGNIDITYTVTNGTGCSDTQTNTITVVAGAPVASFTTTPISLSVGFTNTSTGGGTYSWNFGDGNTSTDENPVHTYATAGTYTVTLTATNACGTNISTQQITVQGCPDIITDGGFEGGAGGGAWTEFSSNFGTPLCDLNSCGNGTGTGPRTGAFWAWFGGIAAFEEGSVSQSITIPVNSTASLSFWVEQIICDSPNDFLKVAIDADTVYTTTGASPLCGQLGYTLQSVSLNAYADGNPHTLTFFSRIYGTNGNGSNFFVDDIQLNVCTGIGFPEVDFAGNIHVVPVPARDFFEVQLHDLTSASVRIDVLDVVGKNVASRNLSVSGTSLAERFETSSWSKGIYTVKITSEGKSTYRKMVLQ